MKKILLSALLLLFAGALAAQQAVPHRTFTLDNGLRVVLCEDHSQPKVYGAVVVHAGSKNEKPTATGVAHYFEHIMFKGTDRIGTTDWKSEKVYLDSISQAYDQLHATTDAAERQRIQKEINRLNIAASKYAIPNEVDAILQKMGCTGLNAGTSYDYTVYYNTLPSNQLSNWMDVYVERFRNPVFRLFQSELEAVYEEKNMYENQMGYDFSRNLFTESFGDHPYSRDVIGHADHLKNPQPSEMQEFFNTYYVANNMALVLVGDFNSDECERLVRCKFGVWRRGELPQQPEYHLPAFDKQKVLEVKQTPIKMGMMVFPGVKQNHPDYIPLSMLSNLLGGGSGLFNRAVSDGRLMEAQFMPLSLEDAGSNVVIYVPTIIGQSHEAAEQIIWDCLDSIKQGNFNDEILEANKISALKGRKLQLEDFGSLSNLFLQLEMEGITYEEWEQQCQRWQDVTRDEVIEVAKKYFDRDHCTLVRSKMGFPKHDGAVKPDWEHLEAQNKDAHSPFAQMIDNMKPDPIRPQVIDYNNDVSITEVTPACQLFSVPNLRNDIFSLDITFRYGEMDDYDLGRAVDYMGKLGCDGKDLQRYNLETDLLGASIWLSSGDETTTLHIGGLDENLDTILSLASRWLFHPTHDTKQISQIVDEVKATEKAAKNSSEAWTSALYDYVVYGEQSEELRRTPCKQWGQRTPEQLHQEVLKIFTRNCTATFSGNAEPAQLAQLLVKYRLVRTDSVETVGPRAFKKHFPSTPQVYYCHNKKFLQSDIDFVIPSLENDTNDMAVMGLFNEYFGGGMNSVVFQEIREFRSLGYSTYGYMSSDFFRRNPNYMYCYLGTQCDKTLDGIEAMKSLLDTFPVRMDKFEPAIEHQVVARNSSYVDFRQLPSTVAYTMERGWTRDRRAEITEQISQLTIADLQAFHKKYIEGRPLIIFISGNAKKFSKKSLKPYGQITEVTYKQMFRF